MLTKFLFIGLLFLTRFYLAQDTLRCNKDLVWNKQEAYYFKKNDTSKQPYSGPVKCVPSAGYLNKGQLINGLWDGVVVKYKKSKKIGFATFKAGKLDGVAVKYSKSGLLKDSSIYSNGKLIYFKEIKRIKDQYVLFELEEITQNDTITSKTIEYRLNEPDEMRVERFANNMKNGISEIYTYKSIDRTNKLSPVLENEEIFKDGNMLSRRRYENGILEDEEFFEGIETVNLVSYYGSLLKIKKVTPLKDGKIHGKVSTFDQQGRLVLLEQYEKGIVIDVQQIKPGFEDQK